MKNILIASSFCLMSISSFAQAMPEKEFKKHIGFNTTIILNNIFQPSGAPFTLMFKNQTKGNQAFRLGASLFFSNVYSNNNNQAQQNFNNNIQLTIGKEFQSSITKRWLWYSGADIAPYFQLSGFELTNQKITNISYGLSLRPFLGLRFNINARLYVATEAGLGLTYGFTNNTNTNNSVTNKSDGNQFSFGLNSASSLFLFYLF